MWVALVRNDIWKEWMWDCIITFSFIILVSRASQLILRMTIHRRTLTPAFIFLLVFGHNINRRNGLNEKAWLPRWFACACMYWEIPLIVENNTGLQMWLHKLKILCTLWSFMGLCKNGRYCGSTFALKENHCLVNQVVQLLPASNLFIEMVFL